MEGAQGFRASDVRALGAIILLSAGGALNLLTGLIGSQFLAPGSKPFFLVIGPALLLCAGWIYGRGYTSEPVARLIVLGGDLAVISSCTLLTPPENLTATPVLFVLPTIFVALFMGLPWVLTQIVIAGCGSYFIISLAQRAPVVEVLQTATLLVGVTAPALLVLVLRVRLDGVLEQTRRLAVTDPLTGILNRRGLEQQAPEVLAAAARDRQTVGVFVADIDHFKRVNDELGHADGDKVLKAVAEAIRASVRSEDVVARLGGEEIAVIATLPQEDLTVLAERIRSRIETTGRPWNVTVSIGVAWTSEAGPDAEPGPSDDEAANVARLWQLLDEADVRMYEAKRAGRNQVKSPRRA